MRTKKRPQKANKDKRTYIKVQWSKKRVQRVHQVYHALIKKPCATLPHALDLLTQVDI